MSRSGRPSGARPAPPPPLPVGRDEQGFAMVTAMAMVAISMVMMMAMVAYTMGEVGQTGQLRQRGSAITLAEGEVDSLVNRITRATGDPVNLPCTASVTRSSAVPDTVQIATTVTYYSDTGSAMSCPVTAGTPKTALIRSVATSAPTGTFRPGRRVMEALIQLAPPQIDQQLNKAIFSYSSLTVSNNATVSGSRAGVIDADIHTNGSFTCNNNQTFSGSITARGSISLNNTCFVHGDAWARTGLSTGNRNSGVGGKVRVSNGNVAMTSNSTASGGIWASGTITWNRCTPTTCHPGDTVAEPGFEPFPRLDWDSATEQAWYTGGFTQVVTNNDCTVSGGANGPGRWLYTNTSTLTVPTILRTTCKVIITNGADVTRLGQHVAVFADGGFDLGGKSIYTSTDSQVRNLYLIQPYSAVGTHPCTATGIEFGNQVTLDSTVHVLGYSPCKIVKSNLSTFIGQLYSGSEVTLDNQLNMIFNSLPVYGVTDGSGAGQQWTAGLLAKRENQ
jgi:hypothetical protein